MFYFTCDLSFNAGLLIWPRSIIISDRQNVVTVDASVRAASVSDVHFAKRTTLLLVFAVSVETAAAFDYRRTSIPLERLICPCIFDHYIPDALLHCPGCNFCLQTTVMVVAVTHGGGKAVNRPLDQSRLTDLRRCSVYSLTFDLSSNKYMTESNSIITMITLSGCLGGVCSNPRLDLGI